MKKPNEIDPQALELRRVLGPLQQAVKDGEMTQQQASETIGKVADSLVASSKKGKRKVGKNVLFGARYGRNAGRRELVWSADVDQHVLR